MKHLGPGLTLKKKIQKEEELCILHAGMVMYEESTFCFNFFFLVGVSFLI